MRRYDDLAHRDRKHHLHPQTSIIQLLTDGPNIIESAKGIRLKDAKGHELIDGLAGLWCVNVGYGRVELADVMKEAAEKLSYFHSFTAMSNPDLILLAEKLSSLAPGDLSHVFFGSGGSDANDTLMKIVWHYHYVLGKPDKKKIISRKGSYHGTSVGAASLTGIQSFHAPYNLPIPEIKHTEMPHYYRFSHEGETEEAFTARMVKALEDMILTEGPETVGAFIAEPISGAGGVIDPPKGYFAAIQKVLRKYDILMIADEVITGYGRCGTWFASEVFGITPDLMSSAKGLTSGYFPMSAAYVTQAIWDVLKEGSAKTGSFTHGYTYSGHPVGAAVALKNLQILEDESLIESAQNLGKHLHQALHAAFDGHPHIGEVRGTGFLAGLQLMADANTKAFFDPTRKIPARVQKTAYDNGLLVRSLPSVTTLALSPPFVATTADVDEMVGILKKSIDEVMAGLSSDDLKPAA